MTKPLPAFVLWVLEQLAPYGDPEAKSMFGLHAVYLDGRAIGHVEDDVLFVKGDAETRAEFDRRGMEIYTYRSRGKAVVTSYRRVSPEAIDDPEEFERVLLLANGAAMRAKKQGRKMA